MVKIEIEYCGAWGYRGPSNELKEAILAALPDAEIDCHSAGKKTSTIEVFVIENGNRTSIWAKGRGDTQAGHAQIIELLKNRKWLAKIHIWN